MHVMLAPNRMTKYQMRLTMTFGSASPTRTRTRTRDVSALSTQLGERPAERRWD